MRLKKYFYHEEWNIAIYRRQPSDSLASITHICEDSQLIWLKKKYHFQADPCLVEHSDKLYIFYEALNHYWTKGHLRCRVLSQDFEELEDFALDDINGLGCHLSFPLVIEHNHQHYLIPESHENQAVYTFQAVDFPKRWRLINELPNQPLIDSIVVASQSGYYLVSSQHKTLQRSIFFTNHLSEPWQATNFVINIDNVHTRLGGGVFSLAGQLYIPCQQNDKHEYGKSLFVKQLMLPNSQSNQWQEVTVSQIISQSQHYPDGIHTLNFSHNYAVMDAKRWVFQPLNFFVRKYRQLAQSIVRLMGKKPPVTLDSALLNQKEHQ